MMDVGNTRKDYYINDIITSGAYVGQIRENRFRWLGHVKYRVMDPLIGHISDGRGEG